MALELDQVGRPPGNQVADLTVEGGVGEDLWRNRWWLPVGCWERSRGKARRVGDRDTAPAKRRDVGVDGHSVDFDGLLDRRCRQPQRHRSDRRRRPAGSWRPRCCRIAPGLPPTRRKTQRTRYLAQTVEQVRRLGIGQSPCRTPCHRLASCWSRRSRSSWLGRRYPRFLLSAAVSRSNATMQSALPGVSLLEGSSLPAAKRRCETTGPAF